MRIKFVGRAHVHWTERHSTGSGKNRKTTTRHYSATENLFEQAIIVYGEGTKFTRPVFLSRYLHHLCTLGSSVGGNSLAQGQHSFPFNFQLPLQLPSSYEGNNFPPLLSYLAPHYLQSSLLKEEFNRRLYISFLQPSLQPCISIFQTLVIHGSVKK